MGMSTAELQQKYKMLPNRRTVTVTPRNRTSVSADTVQGAVRRPVTKRDIVFGNEGGIGTIDAVFLLPVANCAFEPQHDDHLTDGSLTWTIGQTLVELEGAFYRVFCVKQR